MRPLHKKTAGCKGGGSNTGLKNLLDSGHEPLSNKMWGVKYINSRNNYLFEITKTYNTRISLQV